MEQKVARCRRRRMNPSRDRRKRSQFLRSPVRIETIPELAADPDNARQPAGKITESNGLDEIVKTTEYRGYLRKSGLFARDGDHEKDRRPRQRSIDALRVDRHPVPTLP